MGKTKGQAYRKAFNAKKADKATQRSAEALLRRADTRVSTTVEADLREALCLAPHTHLECARPASSWLAAAHLAQAALSTATGAPPADSQSASDRGENTSLAKSGPDDQSVTQEAAL